MFAADASAAERDEARGAIQRAQARLRVIGPSVEDPRRRGVVGAAASGYPGKSLAGTRARPDFDFRTPVPEVCLNAARC